LSPYPDLHLSSGDIIKKKRGGEEKVTWRRKLYKGRKRRKESASFHFSLSLSFIASLLCIVVFGAERGKRGDPKEKMIGSTVAPLVLFTSGPRLCGRGGKKGGEENQKNRRRRADSIPCVCTGTGPGDCDQRRRKGVWEVHPDQKILEGGKYNTTSIRHVALRHEPRREREGGGGRRRVLRSCRADTYEKIGVLSTPGLFTCWPR